MMAIASSTDTALSALDKGAPSLVRPIPIADVAAQGWNLLAEDLALPAAVIVESALRNNSRWMKSFVESTDAQIAPHGKTTMAPALFDLQLADGAWGITVSTLHQLRVARLAGYSRIFFANQLIGKAAISYLVSETGQDPSFDVIFLIDSLDNLRAIEKAAADAGLSRPLTVLAELGYEGGRTGCRTKEEALVIAEAIQQSEFIDLVGIEGFEGLLKAATNEQTAILVSDFLDRMVDLAQECERLGFFASEEIILSAGGSSFYDIVARKLRGAKLSCPPTVLLRSGCYITHDSMMYARAVAALRERDFNVTLPQGDLRPALEVWAYVQSRPEGEKLIAALGKRDVSHDELPVAIKWFRPGGQMDAPLPVPEGHTVSKLNDQHAHISAPADSPLRVGDLVCFGISHPCLTFDKWRVLHVVDDDYNVVSAIRTYF
ncbi:MAG: amino acid deaminase [Mesorhizobium sp.]|uniref:amino acid deaminase n=1 Tax=Mesorhizobium sp. TaxID=1871066 RepID=UPI000FEA9528|nr:amino acid deaminase [Mesorhizobium sp.]RWB75890.1 MAG: amino acid deaminase [Mesorhizobium sp.]